MVTVTDAMSCSTVCNVTVGATGNAPQCSILVTDASCGDANGTAQAMATGGTGGYTYLWSTGATSMNIDGLISGTYSVTITDSAGCNSVCTTTISSIGGPVCTVSVIDAECGANTGAAFASASGGTGVYSYSWNTGATSPTISGLAAGTYTVTVTDDKGCQTVCSAVIMTAGGNCGTIGNIVWNDINGDGIYDPVNESGMEGVTVVLYDAITGLPVGTTTTNVDGEYSFTGLPAGDYYVEFGTGGFVGFLPTQVTGQNGGSDVTGQNGPGTTGIITLGAGEVNNDVDAGYYKGGSIGNTVWCDNEDNPGTFNTLDSNDTRVEGVVVTLYRVDLNTGMEEEVATTTTDINGNYLFSPLEPGFYQVEYTISADKWFVSPNSGTDDTVDGDVITYLAKLDNQPKIGRTGTIVLGVSEVNLDVDAGTTTRKPLKIELLTFDGEWNAEAQSNDLTWVTSLEINSDYISVERTTDLSEDFAEIGTRRAQGNSSAETEYELDDTEIFESGIYYYRLKLVDYDGTYDYSKVIAIEVRLDDKRDQDIEIGVYPNPVIEKLSIDITVERVSEVEGGLYDAIGQLIKNLEVNGVKAGASTISVDVTDVPVGTYLLRIDVEGQVYFEKISIIE